jgi:N,N'-diacetyllegionaminate synthase
MSFEFAGTECVVIAEVAQSHDGSLGTAHAYIDAVAEAGVGAVKFQTHIAHAESSPAEPWRVKFSPQDATRFDYWKRMEFTEEQWAGLAKHAAERGMAFLSSPFSMEALELLERLGVPAWKVAAGEITNLPMLERMAQSGKPVLLSSGLSSWSDLDHSIEVLRRHGAPFAILQCTTAYPCPPERLGLNVMAEIRNRYGCKTGLSDHSGTLHAGIAAAALGADFIEVHTVLSRKCFGPDVPASITVEELSQLVAGVRFVRRAIDNPVSKDQVADELHDLKLLFGKSVWAAHDLSAGQQLRFADLSLRKPGTGIPASRVSELLSRRAGSLLTEDDFEF